jgi:hypothetical protein
MNATITTEGLLIPKEWLQHFGDIKIHRDDWVIIIMPTQLSPIVVKSIDTLTSIANAKPPLNLNSFAWSQWPTASTFRREELYDDDGR